MSESAGSREGTLIERMKKRKAPVADLVGFAISEAADGRAVAVMRSGPQHWNPMGTLHGGVLCDLADAAMGYAFASTLEAGESFTTVELKINYLRPVREAELRAEARVIHRGRSMGYVECEVSDERGKLVAKSNSTCLILRGEQAAGR